MFPPNTRITIKFISERIYNFSYTGVVLYMSRRFFIIWFSASFSGYIISAGFIRTISSITESVCPTNISPVEISQPAMSNFLSSTGTIDTKKLDFFGANRFSSVNVPGVKTRITLRSINL